MIGGSEITLELENRGLHWTRLGCATNQPDCSLLQDNEKVSCRRIHRKLNDFGCKHYNEEYSRSQTILKRSQSVNYCCMLDSLLACKQGISVRSLNCQSVITKWSVF